MKKNSFFKTFLGALLLISVLTALTVLPSCSSRKAYNRLEIERLFMQTTKPEIGFINHGGLNGQDGSRTVSEQVSFSNSYDSADKNVFDSKVDTNTVYALNEVVLEVKSNFVSERDGKANIDFNIIAPIDILDPNWRLYLAPQLIDGDSVTYLDTVIITGEGFKDKQDSDYEAYKDFLDAIVDPGAYDSLYIDWKGLYKEITKVQKRNYNDYREGYNALKGYENWGRMNEMEFLDMEALAMRHKRHLYERHWRKAEKESLNNLKNGKDTIGVFNKHIEKYKKDYVNFVKNKFSLNWVENVDVDINLHKQKDSVLVRSHIPRMYREIHDSGRTLNDIQAKAFTKDDSIKIAKRHYLIDEIVLNEMNINRKDDVFREVVEFPFRADLANVRIDTVISGEYDIIYEYKQPWTVKPGMKNLKVVINGYVEGIDRSVFKFPHSDTLNYFIASLSQLLDESLVTKREKLHKTMFDKISAYPKYKTNKAHKFEASANAGVLDQLLEAYSIYSSKPEYSIDSITIQMTTDLTGEWGNNYDLSHHRATSVSSYLESKISAPLKVSAKGEDWSTLVREIQKRSDMPNGSEIVDILSKATFPDQTEDEIKKQFPADYKIIRDEIYPKLQRIDFLIDISRTDIEKDTIRETFREDYAQAITLMKNREYMPALEILADYPDYNTALCLVCLGYNDKAEEVLTQLPESAKNEYLLAIIYARKNENRKASDSLVKACKLDPNLYDRISLDAEVNDLANKLNLWSRLSML